MLYRFHKEDSLGLRQLVPFLILVSTCLCALLACRGQAPMIPSAPKEELQLSSRLERLLPLTDNTVSTFVSESEFGEQSRFMLEIFRPSEDTARLSIAGRTEELVVGLRSIEHVQGGYLLKEPLKQGARFRGRFGEVVISRVTLSVIVPAGKFENCLQTVEESLLPPKRATSIYCPDVGLVSLIVESEASTDLSRLEASLLRHEKRIDL